MTEIIIALDVPEISEASGWVDRLGNDIQWYKVGLELFTREGVKIVQLLEKKGKNVFLDLKFHDIPRTVARAVAQVADIGAQMINVHTVGGKAMMEAAAEELVNRTKPPKLVGVTVLTSMDAVSLKEIGIRRSPKGWVADLALMAQECGLDGAVASPREVRGIRDLCGQGFLIVTPGIRLPGSAADDQRRTATPAQAKKWGADFIVVGRPVLTAEDPLKILKKIQKELEK